MIDDYVPFYSWGDAALAKPSDNKGLWPILLEKAFAKFHGNFKAIDGGYPKRAIEMMTGWPGFYNSISERSVDTLWNELVDGLAQKNVIVADTKFNITYSNALVPGHAYSVVGAFKLSNGVRLVKMMNPWGVDSYTGEWSDTSTKWNPTLRKEVGAVDNNNDGVFF